MTIKEIEHRLIEGNERFVADKLDGKLQDSKRRDELTGGQEPYAIILSCADSRVIPELAFDTGIGEIFVVRVAGNVADTTSIASIEYAVAHLNSRVIVVLGHQSCGAVTAAAQGGDNGYNLNILLSHIAPALASSENLIDINEVVKNNAILQVKELTERSSIISNAVSAGDVKVIPAYYNLGSGKIDFLS